MTEPSGRRARQAQQTRDDILRAARALFAERGYAGTTVRDVAERAGVSVQTVYDSVGSKQRLVERLNDLIDAEAGIADIVVPGMASTDARDVAAIQPRITRSILERCGDIARALVTGASAEPELAAVLAEGHRRHVDGARRVVAVLEERGSLAATVDATTAAETLAALTDLRFALLLEESYGWSLERIEAWMLGTCEQLLLVGDGGRSPRRRAPRS